MVVNYIDNFYVRRLTGLYVDADGTDPLAADPEGALRTALAALDSLDFVGLSEDTDGALAVLGARLGFEPPAQVARLNVTRAIDAPADAACVAADLERLTALDRHVYEAAVRRWQQERTEAVVSCQLSVVRKVTAD